MKVHWERNKPVQVATYAKNSTTNKIKSVWHMVHNYSVKHEKNWNSFNAQVFFFQQFVPAIPGQGCGCSSFFTDYCQKNPPNFKDHLSFRTWCRVLHNAVNQKLSAEYPDNYYPQISEEQYNYLWSSIAPRKSSRLVITVGTGTHKNILKHSRISFKEYARRHGADYIELTNEVPTAQLVSSLDSPSSQYNYTWHHNKIRVGALAAQYDQTLYLDADCIITDKCRDLFQYPGIAILDDYPILSRNKILDWIHPEINTVMASQQLPFQSYWERCLNTGVVLCTRENNPWVMPQHPLPMVHCAEQFWVDYNIKDFVSLPDLCNWQWWRGQDFWRGLQHAEIIHFANCPHPTRLELIQWAATEYGIS